MDHSALSRARRLLNQLPAIAQVVQACSAHRHVVLSAGVLLVILVAWIGVRDGIEVEADINDETFAEMHGFDAPPAPLGRLQQRTEPLVLPAALPADEVPFDLGPTFGTTRSAGSATNAMHVVSQPIEPIISAAPAWLTGTIEAVEEAPQPQPWAFSESDIRYIRPTKR